MATFPLREADVSVLADEMVTGLAANLVIYPTPPVIAPALGVLLTTYTDARDGVVAAQAAAEAATTAKDAAYEALVDGMKTDIRYAENTVDYDDDKLKLIGWAGRKASTSLTAPGQTPELTVPVQGDGTVSLAWKAPIDGGAPQAYKVMRRERPAGAWEDVHTAVITEAQLTDQPKALELEYQIIAVNKAGEGQPSNTQMVVL